MSQLAQEIPFGRLQAGSSVEFQVRQEPFALQPSKTSALESGQGDHLVITRKDNEKREFLDEQMKYVLAQSVRALFKDEVKVLGLGQNLGKARNELNQHPHLHILVSKVAENELPKQWQAPAADAPITPGRATIKQSAVFSASDIRSCMEAVVKQHEEACKLLAGVDSSGARIIQQLVREDGGSVRVCTFTYTGLTSDKDLPRLVQKKSEQK